ncbi:hypothetical protein WA026_004847 [Henosepilachna vigintioctopunctata]|uniref:C2H2-type domain-containing protein n=1 Tax=Henosepilachna vigintioctopunctata TaxID=420089 RepID=A0AAW1UVP0_9CUCU
MYTCEMRFQMGLQLKRHITRTVALLFWYFREAIKIGHLRLSSHMFRTKRENDFSWKAICFFHDLLLHWYCPHSVQANTFSLRCLIFFLSREDSKVNTSSAIQEVIDEDENIQPNPQIGIQDVVLNHDSHVGPEEFTQKDVSVHRVDTLEDTFYVCHVCRKFFKSAKHLKRHMDRSHPGIFVENDFLYICVRSCKKLRKMMLLICLSVDSAAKGCTKGLGIWSSTKKIDFYVKLVEKDSPMPGH